MNTTDELTGIAAELLKAADLDGPADPQEILFTSWSDLCRVHDWRNYIPEEMRDRWLLLSPDARVVAYVLAAEWASREEWD